MKDLKKLLGKRLGEKKIAKISKGAYLVNCMNSILEDDFNLKIKVSGKLENNIFFVKSSNSSLSSIIFINKKDILEKLNKKLHIMELGKINDIKII